MLSLIIIGCILIFVVTIFLADNGNKNEPIDHLMNAINNNNISEIPQSFHEYCSLAIKQNISEENFSNYIDALSQDFGKDFKMSYKISSTDILSRDDLEMYETNAKFIYSDYPYLSNGGDLDFEQIIKVSVTLTIKGEFQEDEGNVDFLIVKIDDKYYFLHTPNQLMSGFINY